jgi:hypothetical protein
MKKKELLGEGNKTADRRYRRAVRETVAKTTADDRAEQARDLTPTELADAREAERRARTRRKS